MAAHSELSSASRHHWTLRSAVGLSVIIALFGTWGWLTHYGLLARDLAVVAGGVLMAGVCLVAQGVCNNLAVEARRARARGLAWSSRFALVVAVGFGSISALGLHHGWQIAAAVAPALGVDPPPDWLTTTLFVFVAFGEPVAFWVVDAIRTQEARALVEESASGPQDGWSPRVVDGGGQAQRKRPGRAATTVGLVGAAALALGGSDAAASTGNQPATTIAAPSTAAVHADAAATRVRAMADQGWSERRIACALVVSRHAVRKMLGRAN